MADKQPRNQAHSVCIANNHALRPPTNARSCEHTPAKTTTHHLLSRAEFIRAVGALAALPVLPSAQAFATPAFKVSKIADGVFVHRGLYELQSPQNKGDIANCGFVVGSQSVAVIDTSGSAILGQQLRSAVASVTSKPIKYVINTHMHPDHVFGNAAFDDGNMTFVGHHKLARGLAARAEQYLMANTEMMGEEALKGTKIVFPNKSVKGELSLDLGGRALICKTKPTAHTDNDMTVFDPQSGTLFSGDLLFSRHIPTIDGSIIGWLEVLKTLKTHTAVRVVPGHGPVSMVLQEAIAPVDQYLSVLAADCRNMIAQGKTMSEAVEVAAQSEAKNWLLFDQYNARNIAAAFAELEWE